jgi:hypothetical protein
MKNYDPPKRIYWTLAIELLPFCNTHLYFQNEFTTEQEVIQFNQFLEVSMN